MNIPNKNFEIRYYISLLFENGKSSILLNIDTTKCGLVKQKHRCKLVEAEYPIIICLLSVRLSTHTQQYICLL